MIIYLYGLSFWFIFFIYRTYIIKKKQRLKIFEIFLIISYISWLIYNIWFIYNDFIYSDTGPLMFLNYMLVKKMLEIFYINKITK